MEKTSFNELILLEKQKHKQSMEKLKADASEILSCVTQLKSIHKHNEMVEANNNKRSQELELKEKELKSLSLDLDKREELFKKEKSEAGEHKDMVEANNNKRFQELELKEKELKSLSLDLDKREELFKKKKSEAGDLKKQVEECREELRSKRNELTAKMDTSTRIQREIELKKKQLGQYLAELKRLCGEAGKIQISKKEMEDEIDRKKKELLVILDQIKESGKQFVMVNEQVESERRLLEMISLEIVSKEEELESVKESMKLSNSELELKEKKIQSLNSCITVCDQQIDSKSKELGGIQKLIEQRTSDLGVVQNLFDSIRLLTQKESEELAAKEKRHKEILETICTSSSEMVERAKEVKAAESEASCLHVRSDRLRHEVEGKEKELNLLKNQIESEKEKLIKLKSEMEKEMDRKKKDLELILSKIKESDQQLEVKEKKVQAIKNLIKISSEQLDLKSKELKEIQRELELKKQLRQMINVFVKREKQPPSATNNDTSQQNAAETEDALMSDEVPVSLSRDEVSNLLRNLPDPAEYVLELVKEDISEASGLHHSFVENLVLIFEELDKIQLVDKSQLQLKAKEVATLWKKKITIESPKPSLEALAFLFFIVAYGLKTLINEEETALLASSIAQYEQAPRLFNSLTLNPKDFAEELIKRNQYIPAVQIICLFKLNKEFAFSPSELLMAEIINLRKSALEYRSTESSQAKEKDAGRLRAILELVVDYKLEINLPGDLIAKLVIQRDSVLSSSSFLCGE